MIANYYSMKKKERASSSWNPSSALSLSLSYINKRNIRSGPSLFSFFPCQSRKSRSQHRHHPISPFLCRGEGKKCPRFFLPTFPESETSDHPLAVHNRL